MKKLLRNRIWQAVGAIAGIIGVFVAVAQLTKDDPPPPPAQQNNNVTQGGTSNCNQNGDNNTCNAPPTPAVENENSLELAKPLWPTLDCDGATMVAAMPDSPDASTVRLDPAVDLRTTLTAKGGAAYGSGWATLSIAAKAGTTVQILGVKPIFYRPEQVQPKWTYAPMGDCGGTYARLLEIDLDKRQMVDKGILGEAGLASPGVKSAPFGAKFHVTHDDPAVLLINANACHGYHEWGVSISYATGGKTFTKIVGTQQSPFRVMGTADGDVPQYTQDRGVLQRMERPQTPYNCRRP